MPSRSISNGNTTLQAALQYAGRGWWVFPLTRSKIPFKGSHGHLDATADAAGVEALWAGKAGANIGLALEGIVVLDADGPGGMAVISQMAEDLGSKLPETLAARTPRGGWHFYYKVPTGVTIRGRNARRAGKGDDGFDIKAPGGYVLLPPSRTAAGEYRWERVRPIAELTGEMVVWLREWTGNGGDSQKLDNNTADSGGAWDLGERPAHLGPVKTNGVATKDAGEPWTAHEEARLRSALKALDATGYDEWAETGMALHHLHWERSDGTDIGFDLWVEWSETCEEKFSQAACEQKWVSFGQHTENRRLRTVASVFLAAKEAGWDGSIVTAVTVGNVNGFHVTDEVEGEEAVLPPVFTQSKASIVFPDTNKIGRPVATCRNARVAIGGLGIDCRYDAFHNRMLVGGHAVDRWAGELSDNALAVVRIAVEREFGFDPGTVAVHDAAIQECLQRAYDPVLDYLNGLRWDGTPRLRTWMRDYLGAADTALNSEIGGLTLVAAVRRARVPGAKFDQITVLEGVEGKNKSTAIEILAGSENFSDQTILTLDDKAQQEALAGVWLYEIADLAGMSRADVERVKAFASRKVDRARPAYGRVRVDQPRRCIFFATTNGRGYLKSETGNRRFWPVVTGHIDVRKLARDRDQLWAEASIIEKRGVALSLAERFWDDARVLQTERLEHDPWDDLVAGWKPKEKFLAPDGRCMEWRATTRFLLEIVLRIPADRQGVLTARRLVFSMQRAGWDGPKTMRDSETGAVCRGYTKPVADG